MHTPTPTNAQASTARFKYVSERRVRDGSSEPSCEERLLFALEFTCSLPGPLSPLPDLEKTDKRLCPKSDVVSGGANVWDLQCGCRPLMHRCWVFRTQLCTQLHPRAAVQTGQKRVTPLAKYRDFLGMF